jgi:DNA-binding NtrC family response regulator
MVVVDVSAVAVELFEAELFGSVKGAFTDAIDREGYIAAAQGGTLFLDELDSLPKPTQAKLLRLLETRRYRRVGDTREHTADVRFILASKSDLRGMVDKDEFREDLYHRVAQLPVTLPPLSERSDEIAPWARFFLQRVAKGDPVTLSASAEAELSTLALPGNLRQLDFVVRRAWVLATPDDPGAFEVLGDHVRMAAASGVASTHRVARALRDAAVAWVDGLIGGDQRLEDEAALIFREYVRVRACERLGVADGFRLLGRTQLVEGRNHQRAYKDALERVAAFDRGDAIE